MPQKLALAAVVAVGLTFTIALVRERGGDRPRADALALAPPDDLTSASTAADREIHSALTAVSSAPESAAGYNRLAAAYLHKARETGDFGFNARAETALKRSFEVDPDGVDGLKLRATLLLTYHRFAEALEVARQAARARPDDYEIYGAVTDALVELGDYEGAVEAAQRMVDLRPYSASYARVSYLRALHGDTQGAIAAMRDAATAANPADGEGRAWYYTQLGDELLNARRTEDARHAYAMALEVFPGSYRALAGLARARVAAGDLEGAADLYSQSFGRVPLPDTAIALGDLYTKLGRAGEAAEMYRLVEGIERASAAESATYSVKLAEFWADHGVRLDDALAAARRERAARADVYTCDVLAWCLLKNGFVDEARSSSDEAMRLGTRDARILYHAGMIAEAQGDRVRARTLIGRALEINPTFDVLAVDEARLALDRLKG